MDWDAVTVFGLTQLEVFAWSCATLGVALLARHVWLARRGRERWRH